MTSRTDEHRRQDSSCVTDMTGDRTDSKRISVIRHFHLQSLWQSEASIDRLGYLLYLSIVAFFTIDIDIFSGRFLSLPVPLSYISRIVTIVLDFIVIFFSDSNVKLHITFNRALYIANIGILLFWVPINFSFVTHLFECTIIRMTSPFVAQRKFSPAWVPSTSVPRFEPRINCMRGGQARSVHTTYLVIRITKIVSNYRGTRNLQDFLLKGTVSRDGFGF